MDWRTCRPRYGYHRAEQILTDGLASQIKNLLFLAVWRERYFFSVSGIATGCGLADEIHAHQKNLCLVEKQAVPQYSTSTRR